MAKELQRVRRIPIECRRSIQPRFYTLRNLAAVSFFRCLRVELTESTSGGPKAINDWSFVRIYFGGLIAVTQIPPSTARATTTLAIVDQKHNQMIVASDSLRLTSNGIISVTSQVCKILVGPNCIFSVAGYVSNSSTNFDLDKLGNEACHEAGTITDKANVFDKLADKPADYVQYIRETAPESYENMKKHGVASAIFLGRENEHFTICLRDFTVRESGVDVHWTNFEDTTAGIVPFVAIGTAELFKAYQGNSQRIGWIMRLFLWRDSWSNWKLTRTPTRSVPLFTS
jgi:hypothetical protein